MWRRLWLDWAKLRRRTGQETASTPGPTEGMRPCTRSPWTRRSSRCNNNQSPKLICSWSPIWKPLALHMACVMLGKFLMCTHHECLHITHQNTTELQILASKAWLPSPCHDMCLAFQTLHTALPRRWMLHSLAFKGMQSVDGVLLVSDRGTLHTALFAFWPQLHFMTRSGDRTPTIKEQDHVKHMPQMPLCV